MTREEFEQLVAEEFPSAVPEKFRHLLRNVAFIVEEEAPSRNLLGLYHGVPKTERGSQYGVGNILPDTITLYQKTIEEVANADGIPVSQVIRDTIWHEVGHHVGLDEGAVRMREKKRQMRRDMLK
jgi:predicted Zn-dependent protease with MMP-like domain